MGKAQWLKERWLEARWGLIYVSFVLSFITAATVTWSDIYQVHDFFPSLVEYAAVAVAVGAFVFAPLVGYLHGKYQNPTDVLKANKPLLDEFRRIVREELDDSRRDRDERRGPEDAAGP
jgi:O-antigen/teichoic acid export membrane protein